MDFFQHFVLDVCNSLVAHSDHELVNTHNFQRSNISDHNQTLHFCGCAKNANCGVASCELRT